MATKKLKFRVTATIIKDVEVEVETDGLSEDEIIEQGSELANQQFDPSDTSDEEKYTQNSELIEE